jgi:hypothetical protein
LFFSATIGLNIVTCVILLAPNIAPVYQAMLLVPNIALENAMACRVYRAVKLGFIKNPQNTSLFGSTVRSYRTPDDSGHELAFKRPTLDESRNVRVTLEIAGTADSEIPDDHETGKRASLVDGRLDAYDQV